MKCQLLKGMTRLSVSKVISTYYCCCLHANNCCCLHVISLHDCAVHHSAWNNGGAVTIYLIIQSRCRISKGSLTNIWYMYLPYFLITCKIYSEIYKIMWENYEHFLIVKCTKSCILSHLHVLDETSIITMKDFYTTLRPTKSKGIIMYIYLINQARGPYWENIGPRSWQYGLSAARSIIIKETEGWYSPGTVPSKLG